jgi:hypothetical protein
MRSSFVLAVSTSLLSISLLAIPAFADRAPAPRPVAQPAADPHRMVTDDCALARKAGKACELSLAAEDVGGSTPGPGALTVPVLRPGTETSLIRLRRDFVVEIVKSAEDL